MTKDSLKKQACWKGLEDRNLIYPEAFDSALISPDIPDELTRQFHAEKVVESSVEAELEVHRLGSAFWIEARNWARERGLLSPRENGILETCAAIPNKIPSDKQCAIAIAALRKLQMRASKIVNNRIVWRGFRIFVVSTAIIHLETVRGFRGLDFKT